MKRALLAGVAGVVGALGATGLTLAAPASAEADCSPAITCVVRDQIGTFVGSIDPVANLGAFAASVDPVANLGEFAASVDPVANLGEFAASVNPANQLDTFINGTTNSKGQNDGLGIKDQLNTFKNSVGSFVSGPRLP
ncbi:hypothetical protein [Mycolicibacterium phlei]